jgi:hypothetical protein
VKRPAFSSLTTHRGKLNPYTQLPEWTECEKIKASELMDDSEALRILKCFINHQIYFDVFKIVLLEFIIVELLLGVFIQMGFLWSFCKSSYLINLNFLTVLAA